MNYKIKLAILASLLLFASPTFGQIVGMDDFDGGEMFLTRTFTPDLSGNPIPGTFPSSNFDVFGIVDRNVNLDLQDDSLIDPGFTGMFPTTVTDMFLAHEDLSNDDNPDNTGIVEYAIDISGASNLMFSIDIAAFGDFETSNDFNSITASIDGSTPETLIELIVDEDATQTYTYENGSTEDFADPMTVNGTFLDNSFQNFGVPITGTGSMLTLTFSFGGNGGNEVIAFNNMLVEGDAGSDLVGDVNCDGVVDLLDVAPFVEAVSNSELDSKADIDGSGADDLLDVAPFVDLLIGG